MSKLIPKYYVATCRIWVQVFLKFEINFLCTSLIHYITDKKWGTKYQILAVVITRTLRPYGKPTQLVARGQNFVLGNF